MNNNGFEIERKYLIRYPNLTILGRNAEATDIVQTYLMCPEPGSSERVRKRDRTLRVYFGSPEYSGDNAVGAALIGAQKLRAQEAASAQV